MDVKDIHAQWLATGVYPLDKKVEAIPFPDAVAKTLQEATLKLIELYECTPEDFIKAVIYIYVRSISSQELDIPLPEVIRRVEEAYAHGEVLKREIERSTSVSDGLEALARKLAKKGRY